MAEFDTPSPQSTTPRPGPHEPQGSPSNLVSIDEDAQEVAPTAIDSSAAAPPCAADVGDTVSVVGSMMFSDDNEVVPASPRTALFMMMRQHRGKEPEPDESANAAATTTVSGATIPSKKIFPTEEEELQQALARSLKQQPQSTCSPSHGSSPSHGKGSGKKKRKEKTLLWANSAVTASPPSKSATPTPPTATARASLKPAWGSAALVSPAKTQPPPGGGTVPQLTAVARLQSPKPSSTANLMEIQRSQVSSLPGPPSQWCVDQHQSANEPSQSAEGRLSQGSPDGQ